MPASTCRIFFFYHLLRYGLPCLLISSPSPPGYGVRGATRYIRLELEVIGGNAVHAKYSVDSTAVWYHTEYGLQVPLGNHAGHTFPPFPPPSSLVPNTPEPPARVSNLVLRSGKCFQVIKQHLSPKIHSFHSIHDPSNHQGLPGSNSTLLVRPISTSVCQWVMR